MNQSAPFEEKPAVQPARALTSLTHPRLQRRATNTAEIPTAPESVYRTLASPGRPLDHRIRDLMETRFGHDFSQVRIHADSSAGESAREVNAHAYTVGSNIVFAPSQYQPNSESGRHLLAHELAHTIQQSGSLPRQANNRALDTTPDVQLEREAESAARLAMHTPVGPQPTGPRLTRGAKPSVARVPVAGYETKPVTFERTDIEKLVGPNYWEQKITAKYSLVYLDTVPTRLAADPEEKNAVLSVVWQRKPPSPIAAETIVSVSIPARAGAANSKALLYQFIFQPAPTTGPVNERKEIAKIDFKGEGSQVAVSAAPAPPPGYSAPALRKDSDNFPNGIDDYWKAHPEENKQLYSWIDKIPGPAFDQIVTTTETPPGGKKHDSSYQVKGTKDTAGKLTALNIAFISEKPLLIENAPADYDKKDLADVELDKLREKASDKLGTVSGLAQVPADELLSVKYAIWQYFKGGTRNKEVDVVIPIAKKQTRGLYTLRFLPTSNNVEVERVGEEGSSVKLSPNALNIERVADYAANSSTPAAFKAWITKRYPSITPAGTTLDELKASVNKELETNAGTEPWFSTNYGIEILDAKTAETRLTTVHNRKAPEVVNLKGFAASDLKRLEFALETMPDATLKIVKGTKMARQNVLIEIKLVGTVPTATPDPTTGGITWQSGTEKTIIIFDQTTADEQRMFLGGSAGVRFSSVETYVHEFGHVLELQATLAQPFADFVKAKKIAPITWYAASKPVTESFPEAFAIYQNDPEWMKNNLPALHTWFQTVTTTGAPPPTP